QAPRSIAPHRLATHCTCRYRVGRRRRELGSLADPGRRPPSAIVRRDVPGALWAGGGRRARRGRHGQRLEDPAGAHSDSGYAPSCRAEGARGEPGCSARDHHTTVAARRAAGFWYLRASPYDAAEIALGPGRSPRSAVALCGAQPPRLVLGRQRGRRGGTPRSSAIRTRRTTRSARIRRRPAALLLPDL